MCTLTWNRGPDELTIFFNRDELRSRGPGIPPTVDRRDAVPFLAPRDSDAGGTWIAANAHGLVLCLLNGYVDDPPPSEATSVASPASPPSPQGDTDWITRGSLIDRRIADVGAEAVAAGVRREPLERFRSFVLCALDPTGVALRIAWLHRKLEIAPLSDASMPVSSSSFDTTGVLSARRSAWNAQTGADPLERHRAYHRQHDPARGAYSVCMARPDARTVSYTEISVTAERVRIGYRNGPPCDPELPWTELDLLRGE